MNSLALRHFCHDSYPMSAGVNFQKKELTPLGSTVGKITVIRVELFFPKGQSVQESKHYFYARAVEKSIRCVHSP